MALVTLATLSEPVSSIKWGALVIPVAQGEHTVSTSVMDLLIARAPHTVRETGEGNSVFYITICVEVLRAGPG